ncbi:hypothetical protein [Haloferula sargassicola]|uniref:Uncharacterized protein n=1 Tax=Haloferula sargassicola TaxID=490096 RepID=A0ABP9UGT1_9BACT
MKPTEQQLSDLLALKRHERPPQGYVEDCLREFHARRAAESRRAPAGRGWWEKVSEWFVERSVARWVYGAGVAYAAIVAVVFLLPREQATDAIRPQPAGNLKVLPIEPVNGPAQLPNLDLADDAKAEVGDPVPEF